MAYLKPKLKTSRDAKSLKGVKGFTLIELILVIIILGIMAVGISGFITLSTQTYLSATNRDGLISNARFVTERLNRELRNAVPNSIRIETKPNNKKQCVVFVPIIASTVYTDIPVEPEVASKKVSVIPFKKGNGDPYDYSEVDGFDDVVIVYPLNKDDVYDDYTDKVGKVFYLDDINKTQNIWQINLIEEVHFKEDSPTKRLYIADREVRYCVLFSEIRRYKTLIGSNTSGRKYLMAEHVIADISSQLPFNYIPGTLTRNSVIQIHFNFTRNEENYIFDHDIHMNNVP